MALSYEELNEMFSKVFFVPAIMDVGSMFSLLKFHPACEFLLSPNLPLLSPSRIFTQIIMYGIFGFANNFVDNGVIFIFHDDDPCILKEIKSFLETNGYEIHLRWVVINTLP